MDSILSLLSVRGLFTIFIAPPAWGKTRLLHTLYDETFDKIVFISPLRALAEEFYSTVNRGGILISSRENCKEGFSNFSKRKRSVLVITPELMDDNLFELIRSTKRTLVVMDEFHLFYYWGTSFRPKLFEAFMGVINSASHVIGLTATFGDEMIRRCETDLRQSSLKSICVNLGNQKLKYYPTKIHYYGNSSILKLQFRCHFLNVLRKKKSGTILYFCKYRSEVDFWIRYLHSKGIYVLGCKGGEAKDFIEKLDMDNPPACIVSTSTLSHGVNLPKLSHVYIGYKISNLDFWIQMVGRGGRKGEMFELHTFDSYGVSRIRLLLNQLKSFIVNIHLAIRYYLFL